jgi:N6-L-threonylcarbamoyladenine synthase
VNHLEGHLYAAWLLDRGEELDEPIFPLVALIVSGGHTFLVEMRDHLTYRCSARPSTMPRGGFDKVGRLLGLVSRRPSIQRRPRPRPATTRAFPGPGSATATTSRFPAEDRRRRTADERGPGRAAVERPGRAPLGRHHRELAWGFQDSVVDVLTTKTVRRPAVGARSIVLAAASPRTVRSEPPR